MIDEILIEAAPGETRAAVVRDGTLQRFVLDRGEPEPRVGDILLGRVDAVAPQIDAAFVDIGEVRPGVLNAADARARRQPTGAIGRQVKVGEAALVQVLATAREGKGAKLTRVANLTGRFLVHLPQETGVHWSKRLGGDARRAEIAGALAGLAGGWIVRTAAASAGPGQLRGEAERLAAAWQQITAAAAEARPPRRLARGPDPIAALIDAATAATPVSRIVIDGGGRLAPLKAAFPDLAGLMTAHPGPAMLFAAAGIEAEIDALLEPVLVLPGGGRLTFTPTPALLAIDVDTAAASGGPPDALAELVNREAMAAIGRRMRLAELAGAAVIDPVPLRRRVARDRVAGWLREAFADDDREVAVAGYTALGKIELTRPRRGPSLIERLTGPCSCCGGTARAVSAETVALAALRAVVAEDRARPGGRWRLVVPAAVATALDRGPARAEAERRLGRPIMLVADERLPADRWRLDPLEPSGERRHG